MGHPNLGHKQAGKGTKCDLDGYLNIYVTDVYFIASNRTCSWHSHVGLALLCYLIWF